MIHIGQLLVLIQSLLSCHAVLAGEPRRQLLASDIFINELHYDNAGTDIGEFVEIAFPTGTDVSQYSLELYKGKNGKTYKTPFSLGSAIFGDDSNGLSFCYLNITGLRNGNQNGDGIALVDPSNTVVQFISYESTFAATNGPASGIFASDIGVQQQYTGVGKSLQLGGTGCVYGDFQWQSDAIADTAGSVNRGQTITCLPPSEPTAAPTAAPPPTQYPTVIGGGILDFVALYSENPEMYPLGLCEGDCHRDTNCDIGLSCFERDPVDLVVPGCSGTPFQGRDYCFAPGDGILVVVARGGSPGTAYPMGRCQGHCRWDSDCDGDLVCFERSQLEEVPGCVAAGSVNGIWNTSYCYDLSGALTPSPTPSPTTAPIPLPTVAPTASPTTAPFPSPTVVPTASPTPDPTPSPTTEVPTASPTQSPTSDPTASPTPVPTSEPTQQPTPIPTPMPTSSPTPSPMQSPTAIPTTASFPSPTVAPTAMPTPGLTAEPSPAPTPSPTDPFPTPMPTPGPTAEPSPAPTPSPTDPFPTPMPTSGPTDPSTTPMPTSPASGLGYPIVLNSTGTCTTATPCGKCEGDCANDDGKCRSDLGLTCFVRSANESVAGCVSGGSGDVSGVDYCYEAPTNGPVTYVPGDLTVFENGLQLSSGLESRIIAVEQNLVDYDTPEGAQSTDYFHRDADGAAVFEDPVGGGWKYVSNAESKNHGGVGVISFNANGEVVGYEMLVNSTYTKRNCGGGKTFWDTWLTCEETEGGHVWEVDPWGVNPPRKTIIGGENGDEFESAAYDNRNPVHVTFYITADRDGGPVYRFTPDVQAVQNALATNPPDYTDLLHTDPNGTAKVEYLILTPAESSDEEFGTFEWAANLTEAEVNALEYYQKPEGIDIRDGIVYFTCKKNRQLFILDLDNGTYERDSTDSGAFDNKPDQVARLLDGDDSILYFCEDTRDGMNGVHGRDAKGNFYTIIENDGTSLQGETTGLAFSPDSMFMYVSYQTNGTIFEIRRKDGYPFDGQRLDIKYHAETDNLFVQ